MGIENTDAAQEMAASLMEKSPEVLEIEKRTRAAAERYVDVWTRTDRAALLNLFAEDGIWMDPVGTPAWKGRAKIGEFWDLAQASGATLKPTQPRIIVCGNEAILLFRMEIRHPSGGGRDVDGCDHFIVNSHGQIESAKCFWDKGCIVER